MPEPLTARGEGLAGGVVGTTVGGGGEGTICGGAACAAVAFRREAVAVHRGRGLVGRERRRLAARCAVSAIISRKTA